MHFLRELSQIFEFVAEERDIEFEINIDSIEEEVWFSPSKIERIVYNLLSNAFKYTPSGGCVSINATLTTEDGARMATIAVKDSGRGIAPDLQPQIYNSYYQVDKRDQRTGFGLGLSLTKSLIELHKGRIELISDTGKGAEFVATINVSNCGFDAVDYSQESITPDEMVQHNRSMQETIELIPDNINDAANRCEDKALMLIVEDNTDLNDYIAQYFANNYTVVQAYNGKQGLEFMERESPDIIISDVMMPIMDGLEFTRCIKENIDTSHIPVILITAKSDVDEQAKGYTVGADAYITKPFDINNLRLLIANMQRNRERNIERFNASKKSDLELITHNPNDSKFMNELMDVINRNIANDSFEVSDVLSELRISRSLLHTKLKALCNSSFTQLLRTIRMTEAKRLIQQGYIISEAGFMVGMSDPSYFTKCFKREFEITPSEYQRSLRQDR